MTNLTHNDINAARQARNIASGYYLFNPRVTLIDIGWQIKDGQHTDQLSVRIHMRNKPSGITLEQLQTESPGDYIDKDRIPFPVDLIEATYPLHSLVQPTSLNHAQRFDPLRGGISISHAWSYGYGTLGGIVLDRNTGVPMILSNWHVLAGSMWAPRGLAIYQPGYGDGGRYQHTVAHLERDGMVQGIDAAVATLTSSRSWRNEQLEIGPVMGVTSPRLGMKTVKSGRASKVTHGVVDGIEGEYTIRYGDMWRKIRHVCRIVPQSPTGEISRPGDSGSWHLNEASHEAVALHFAGSNGPETALAIDMPRVLSTLDVTLPSAEEGIVEEPSDTAVSPTFDPTMLIGVT